MQLPKGERAILSYYTSFEQASQAVEELKEAGHRELEVTRLPKFQLSNPAGPAETLSGAQTAINPVHEYSESWGAFMANWNETGIIEDYTIMVTLVVHQRNVDKALSIVKKYASIVN
ncbi:MAG: hypothetical protein GXY50_09240 [Syntrophomonadaceae bacterium]|nr:hypothetical protein [Syntrophomonadaceae bacterium]